MWTPEGTSPHCLSWPQWESHDHPGMTNSIIHSFSFSEPLGLTMQPKTFGWKSSSSLNLLEKHKYNLSFFPQIAKLLYWKISTVKFLLSWNSLPLSKTDLGESRPKWQSPPRYRDTSNCLHLWAKPRLISFIYLSYRWQQLFKKYSPSWAFMIFILFASYLFSFSFWIITGRR